MKNVQKIACWICAEEYDTTSSAQKCEAKGIILPHHKIGDLIRYQLCTGSDRDGGYYEDRKGIIQDILLPFPKGNHSHLSHDYQIFYIVRKTWREVPYKDEEKFFDSKNIELFQVITTTDIVYEGNVYIDVNIKDPSLKLTIRDQDKRARRISVTSWAQYIAAVAQDNPQLSKRLYDFTEHLKKIDCLDN